MNFFYVALLVLLQVLLDHLLQNFDFKYFTEFYYFSCSFLLEPIFIEH